jgi:hypothetical protein
MSFFFRNEEYIKLILFVAYSTRHARHFFPWSKVLGRLLPGKPLLFLQHMAVDAHIVPKRCNFRNAWNNRPSVSWLCSTNKQFFPPPDLEVGKYSLSTS